MSFLGCQGKVGLIGWCLAYRGCWLVGRDVVSKNVCGCRCGAAKRAFEKFGASQEWVCFKEGFQEEASMEMLLGANILCTFITVTSCCLIGKQSAM